MNAVNPGGDKKKTDPTKDTWSDRVKTIGGLVAVVVGVLAVLVIGIIAMVKNTETSATIASAMAGVIATIVGAYFGVKVGSDQSKTANEGQQAEAAKAQVYAAYVPAEQATAAIAMADEAAQTAMSN